MYCIVVHYRHYHKHNGVFFRRTLNIEWDLISIKMFREQKIRFVHMKREHQQQAVQHQQHHHHHTAEICFLFVSTPVYRNMKSKTDYILTSVENCSYSCNVVNAMH